ncbi:hypothetical protein FRUB_03764 [Fimbriiglobus ruber]|uniref:Glycosyltransferase RgtA/B/C/D-like domain-containing protein n=1 Tax=Fimbriiglobus ruber TaxID=1908690 RepID=A0A225DVM2_9BACT|nr:hypothetical protein FRUB_03764 [Fimbriiglobus ruber]
MTAAAILIDLGSFHKHHHSDSFLPVLLSIHKWTFYYWEQNRYGMLVALLATPFDHPFTNLLVQNGITLWAGLMCFPLAARWLTPGRAAAVAGPAAAATFVAFAPPKVQWVFMSNVNVFSVSLALGLAGLLALRTRRPVVIRAAVAAACFAVGSWVNSALGLLLFPVVVLTALARWAAGDLPLRAAKPEGWWGRVALHPVVVELVPGAAASLFGVVVALVLQRLAPYKTTWVIVPPPEHWWLLIEYVGVDFWEELRPRAWAGFLCGCAAAGGALVWDRRTRDSATAGTAIAAATTAGATAYGLLLSILFHGLWRYSTPAAALIHAALVAVVVRPLAPLWPAAVDRRAVLVGGAAVAVASVVTFGFPSVSAVERDVRTQCGQGVDELIEARCTHVTGEYWRVWRAVFAVNWVYAERGDPRRVWGVTFRSGPTAEYWKAVPLADTRIGAFPEDQEWAADYLKWFDVPMRPAELFGPLVIYVPAAPAGR